MGSGPRPCLDFDHIGQNWEDSNKLIKTRGNFPVLGWTTVNIRLYSTLAHFVAPVPAMHACGARCQHVLESSAIVLVCTEIAADCGLKALSIAEFQHATGLCASSRSLSDAPNYLFDTRSAAIMCPLVRPRPQCPQIRKPHNWTRNPHSTSKRTFPDLPARPFRPHLSSLQPPTTNAIEKWKEWQKKYSGPETLLFRHSTEKKESLKGGCHSLSLSDDSSLPSPSEESPPSLCSNTIRSAVAARTPSSSSPVSQLSNAISLAGRGVSPKACSPKRQSDINDTTEFTSEPSERDDARYSPCNAVTSMATAFGKMVDLSQQCAIVDGSTAFHSCRTISDASCKWAAAPSRTPRITAGGARARER